MIERRGGMDDAEARQAAAQFAQSGLGLRRRNHGEKLGRRAKSVQPFLPQ